MRFFQAEFTKIMTHDQFSKEYAYNIRHRYGKEGKRTEYSPYGCYKLVMDMAPGPGEYHGCPYRHFDADHLAAVLSKTSLDAGEQSLVLGKAKERNYQIACQRHFEFAHKKQTVRGCVEINQCVGCTSHFSAMACWLGRAVMSRHRHAIEQIS